MAPRLLQPCADPLLVGLEVVGDSGLDIGLRLLRRQAVDAIDLIRPDEGVVGEIDEPVTAGRQSFTDSDDFIQRHHSRSLSDGYAHSAAHPRLAAKSTGVMGLP